MARIVLKDQKEYGKKIAKEAGRVVMSITIIEKTAKGARGVWQK